MTTSPVCPACRKPLRNDAPQGLCPECLIKSGFNTGTDPGQMGSQTSAAPSVEELRPLFPQLEILELVGRGGMGAVYKARQAALDRPVALKILSAASGTGFTDRFNREARALARLNHPRIVAVHDFGQAGSLHYLLMEYVNGPNLRQVQRSGELTPELALRIVPQVCEALQFAHDQGIVHRDIKPENLLLDADGLVKITDFGIAKIVGGSADATALTGAQDVVGTPHYMAPEQIETPARVDHRADIYSLGVVLYEMLTGELPLGRFAAPSSRVQVDVRLDEVVLRTLEKEPARRYQQAGHVKTRIETIAASPHHADEDARRPFAPQGQPVSCVPAVVFYTLQAALVVPGELELFRGNWANATAWIAAALLTLVAAYIAWGVLHYRCWAALPGRFRATTPGQAVGFAFIPFFNFYWAFVTFPGLASGFNAMQAEHPHLRISNVQALAIVKAVLFVAFWTIAWVPGFASIIAVVDAVVFAVFYWHIAANANALLTGDSVRLMPAAAQ